MDKIQENIKIDKNLVSTSTFQTVSLNRPSDPQHF